MMHTHYFKSRGLFHIFTQTQVGHSSKRESTNKESFTVNPRSDVSFCSHCLNPQAI